MCNTTPGSNNRTWRSCCCCWSRMRWETLKHGPQGRFLPKAKTPIPPEGNKPSAKEILRLLKLGPIGLLIIGHKPYYPLRTITPKRRIGRKLRDVLDINGIMRIEPIYLGRAPRRPSVVVSRKRWSVKIIVMVCHPALQKYR